MKKLSLLVVCFFFLSASAQRASDGNYGDNLIAIHPYFGYLTSQLGDVGLGISYERFLTDYISAKLPINYGMRSKLFQSGLGIKLYPAGHDRVVKYGVGPSLLFSRSSEGYEVSKYDSLGMFFYNEEIQNPLTQLGFVLTNSINFTMKEHVYIGAEMGIGMNFINHYKEENIELIGNQDPNILFMFTLSMGYRF